ncbi:MAG: T9SS type A sorting domain-containing protein [bacterium]|nr:T9SS type A sorting domain-containing protein [Candidatus Kapabacteria bacterium]
MRSFVLLALFALSVGTLAAQPAEFDATFNPGAGFTGGLNSGVIYMGLQTDDKIVAVGGFGFVNGARHNCFARLNADGSVDQSYSPATPHNWVNSLMRPFHADGSIVAGGQIDGTDNLYLAHVGVDGTPVATFHSGVFDNSGYGVVMAPMSGGKIVVGGNFNKYDSVPAHRLIRLNADGTRDASFQTDSMGGWGVSGLTVQPDGKLIVNGEFELASTPPYMHMVRLNTDGSVDTSFHIGTGFNAYVDHLLLQPDGKMIVVGDFSAYNGASAPGIARLNADGSQDGSFTPGSGYNDYVRTSTLQRDGKIVSAGKFSAFDGTGRNTISRLNPDGTLDHTFEPSTGFRGSLGSVGSLGVQSDGRIIAAGWFTSYNGRAVSNIARLVGDAAAGLTDDLNYGATLAPNPVASTFTVSSVTRIDRVTVTNARGETIATVHPAAFSASVDLSGHPAGTYMVTINSGKRSNTSMVVKQ